MTVNRAIIVGRLGKDPEIRHTQGGSPIANFWVATSETWRDKSGEKKEKTEWHNVVIFNENQAKLAEKYLTKGSMVYLEGKIATRKWQDKDGKDRYTTEIVLGAFDGVMRFLSSPKDKDGSKDSPPPKAAPSTANLDDEIPF